MAAKAGETVAAYAQLSYQLAQLNGGGGGVAINGNNNV